MRRVAIALMAAILTTGLAPMTLATPTSPLAIQQTTPNDPYYGQQWYLRTTKVNSAWEATVGVGSTAIAVIDTGVDMSHPDLVGRLWTNNDETPSNGIDDDHNGYTDDYYGYNFMDNNANIADVHGHGTGIASIIAATANNSQGLAGINWNAKIMVLKALDSLGGGDFDDVAQAMRYAVDNGAQVINMSFGSDVSSAVLASAADYVISRGVPMIAAVGNKSSSQVYYPAAYPQVVAVTAVDQNNQHPNFANTGSAIDISAPGTNIVMAGPTASGAYVVGDGTSFAAAQVTGIISLMLARMPSLSVQQIDNILRTTADPIGYGSDKAILFGAGLVNADKAVRYQSQTLLGRASVSGSPAAADGAAAVTVVVTVSNDFNQLLPNTKIQATITGANNIVNGQPVTYGQPIDLGNTNTSGQITFTVSSTTPEDKQVALINPATSAPLASVVVSFKPLAHPVYKMQWVGQSPYPALPLGGTASLWVEIKNVGNVAWVSDPNSQSARGQIRLGTDRPRDRASSFYDSSWPANNRVGYLGSKIIQPGETGRFTFTIKGQAIGASREYFTPVIEYITWLNDLGIYWDVNVISSGATNNADQGQSAAQVNPNPAAYQAEVQSRSLSELILSPGQTTALGVGFRNIGSAAWLGQGVGAQAFGEVRLGTALPFDRSSILYQPTWISANRVLASGFTIPPGATLDLQFTITAPTTRGTYQENFQLVAEHITWFGPVFGWRIIVE
ncbi:MAG: S8 family serine peptidase [bacterium]